MKKWLALLLAFIMCLSLCACGDHSAEKVCPDCNGDKTVLCSVCAGRGNVDCPNEKCENGIIGVSCSNCGGREGIDICSRCDGNKSETRSCETCGGDGIIVNPITWEKFQCGNCDGLGQAAYPCSRCGGYGLICHYCRSNAKNYPSEKYHPYYIECSTCEGKGTIQCDNCMGAKQIPCSNCSLAEYEAFIAELTAKQEAKQNEVDEIELIETAITMLTGFSTDDPWYYAEPVNADILQSTKAYLLEYKRDFEDKDDLLKQIEGITPYVDSTWEFVEGDPKFFLPTQVNHPEYYVFSVTYNHDEWKFCIHVHPTIGGTQLDGGIFYLSNSDEYVFKYQHGVDDSYKVFMTGEGNLLFNQYKSTYGKTADEIINSCVLKKVTTE